MKLIEALGLDYKLLIAQFVNFAILLLVLYKLGYKPILKFIEERTGVIKQGVENAAKAKQALVDAQAQQQEIITVARKEAQSIITEAREQAEKQAAALLKKNKQDAQLVIDKAKKDIRTEHDKMIQQAKSELSDVVLLATEKILTHKLDAKTDKEFIEKTLADIK